MTTYKEIFGKPVKVLSTDPTDAQAEGQVWYNTTDGVFKTVLSVGAWSSGGALNTARKNNSGAGTVPAGLTFGEMPGLSANSEEYDGTSWTEGNNLNTGRGSACGFGTQTAAVMAAGHNYQTTTENYDGTSWTAGGALSTGRRYLAGFGTQTAGVAALGFTGSSSAVSEEYNGTSWTAGGTANTARFALGGVGTLTAGVVFGGGNPPAKTNVEEYNGTAWTEVNDLPTANKANQSSGTQTDALSFGGAGDITTTLGYDGTNWSAKASMAAGKSYFGGFGGTGAIACGGDVPTTTTEEFNYSIYAPVAASWAAGGNLNTARDSLMTAAQATQNAALVFGGHTNAGEQTVSESYDGSSWTATNALPAIKQLGGGAGTQTAALAFAGNGTAASTLNTTESWDGSNWTAVAAPGGTLATGRFNGGSAGVQGAALLFGGGPPTVAVSEEWNGSSWSPGGSLSRGTTGANNLCGAGIQTSALAMGGTAPAFVYNTTEEYNGTSWTGGGGMNTARRRAAAAASTVDSGLCFGGLASPGSGQTAVAETYDGSSWTNTGSMGTARYFLGGSGATQGDGFAMGGLLTGLASNYTNATEEYTVSTDPLGYKTLTTS